MKIIYRGKKPTTARISCPECYSRLEITVEDVHSSNQYNNEEYWVVCPVCGHCIDVERPSKLFPWQPDDQYKMMKEIENIKENYA